MQNINRLGHKINLVKGAHGDMSWDKNIYLMR